MISRTRTAATLAATLAVGLAALAPSVASAEGCPEGSAYSECGAGWETTAVAFPSTLKPGGIGVIAVNVLNVGAGGSTGRVTVTDTLPAGLEATAAGTEEFGGGLLGEPTSELWECSGAKVVTCVNNPTNLSSIAGGGGAPTIEEVRVFQNTNPMVLIDVRAANREVTEAQAKADPNRVVVAGGGAPTPASNSNPVPVSATPASKFGFVGWDGWASNANGSIDTRAGSHPYEVTTSFDLASAPVAKDSFLKIDSAGGETRNVEVKLPPGFVGNPNAVPQCTHEQLNSQTCPIASQVGIQTVTFANGGHYRERLFNMVPPPGVSAEFGASDVGVNTFYDATVRSGGDYGITVHVVNIAERQITSVMDTFWGVPSDPTHDRWRSERMTGCTSEQLAEHGQCTTGSPASLKPFLTMPTQCGRALPWTIRANTWLHPETTAEATFYSHDAGDSPVGLTGCETLTFAPALSVAPDTARADWPTGLTVEVRPPVGGLEEPAGDGTADIQNTTVTLPEGLVINPGQAAGLQACQAGDEEGGDDLPLPGEDGEEERFAEAAKCPNASKVGTVKIKSPLIEQAVEKEFEGNVYVLQSNPPELKLLVAASADGVNLKLVGVVHLNEQTGRLTTTFTGTPELPFSVFKLAFSGGAQAALDTPTHCGVYGATSDFTPWASPFIADAFPTAGFAVSEGPGGSGCPGSPLPFNPVMTAGSTTDHAGGFTDFSLLLERGDGEQRIERLQFKAPRGLAGMISAVPLCGEPQAAQGTCPSVSQVGHSSVASGPGPYPLVVPQPGEPESPIFLTGPYDGAPFGLSIVTHVIAGPFNLGTIVTRAKIEIDPQTAQITITTDPLPQVVAGVPTDLRLVDAIVDRPGFMFNPTNCEPSSFSGTAWGAPAPGGSEAGETAAISSHFGVGSCKELAFKPSFTTSTKAQASKADGTSLSFKISYPKNAQGNESWFNEAKFDIPRQLPARLSTIQQACLAATFEANRGACPKASIIGHAVVKTQVLPVPLEGPVYFVSYGGAKFPDAVLDLHGDNVHIELHGETFINNKTGVTSATFRNTPDVPFESIEVNVPAGPFSEFGTNVPEKDHYNLCHQKLTMPTLFKAQSGLEIKQNTPVTIVGCHKAKPARKAKKHGKKGTRGGAGKGKGGKAGGKR
jgi:hypothetical protein